MRARSPVSLLIDADPGRLQGSLHPALHRLEHQGSIRTEWRNNETGREGGFHTLTKAGAPPN